MLEAVFYFFDLMQKKSEIQEKTSRNGSGSASRLGMGSCRFENSTAFTSTR